MSKEQLIALIDAKIAGQGNQVDIAGVLADVLKAAIGGAVAVEVADITAIDGKILDSLKVGDKVAKVTGTDKHLYVVTYKAEVGGGICLTYFDALNTETVAYDRTESGWVYNSTDKGAIPSA